MKTLDQNSETRRLFNPAFTGSVLVTSAHAYQGLARSGLPFAYLFLVLPLVLHAETRNSLPVTMTTKLVTWTERNGEIVAGFSERLEEMKVFTSQGALLSALAGIARFSEDGAVVAQLPSDWSKYSKEAGSREVTEILKKSDFVGKWLAAAGTTATVLTALGVRLARHPS